ncbi:MAG: hypothetical protein JWM39_838 [Parcubacteria group bacterium]|nr:hypothetical protein [Parcubacteria group bacterium]
MNELTIDGKIYISSKKAADLTGYAKDYIGQLCREGHVEARMVGRSWYVLETSIRAHRFGGDPHATPIEAAVEAPLAVSVTDAWEKPTYVQETVPSMLIPTVQRPAEPEITPVEAVSSAESLTDMQAAWKEWFSQKQDTLIETPEIIDAREEAHNHEDEIARNIQAFKDAHQDIEASEHEVEPQEALEEQVSITPIHHAEPEEPVFDEIEEESEPVLIHHAPEVLHVARVEQPVLSKKERKQAQVRARKARRARTESTGGSFVLQALLFVLILVAIVVAIIGTGYAANYVRVNPILLPVFDYLGGTSTFTK